MTALVKYFSNLSLDQNGHIVNFFNNLFSKNIFGIGVYFLPLSCYTNFCCSACPRTEISAPVAQLDRALDSDSKGHWFESSRAYQEDPLKPLSFKGFFFCLHKVTTTNRCVLMVCTRFYNGKCGTSVVQSGGDRVHLDAMARCTFLKVNSRTCASQS